MRNDGWRIIAGEQDGVIARRQFLASGGDDADLARLVRRRELARLLPGVYLDHTGVPTWEQRAWAAVLSAAPAALAGASAVRASLGPGWPGRDDAAPIRIVVPHRRTPLPIEGVVITRSRHFSPRVQHLSPPRVRLEHALLECAWASRDRVAALGVLAEACQSRRTRPERLLAALDECARAPDRAWWRAVLTDLAQGSCSVLEHRYLTTVERAHGLPRGSRQVRDATRQGVVWRDVEHRSERVLIELDGRAYHDSPAQRDRDLERDLIAATDGRLTVRLGWGQVVRTPCRSAASIARILAARGWEGVPRRCGADCTLEAERVGSRAPGA